MAVNRDDKPSCERWYDLVMSAEEFYAEPIADGRFRGLLAHTIGNLDKAVEHFGDALDICRSSDRLPELAWTCYDYSETLLLRNGPGDRQTAKSMLEESLSISSDLGMLPLMDRVVALQERADSRPSKASAFPDGLSYREVEVLRLIAVGRTDREIGEELFISARTVGSHVSNILNKTNTNNRAEAAAYAATNGITVLAEPDTSPSA